jgi:quinolinate synthase
MPDAQRDEPEPAAVVPLGPVLGPVALDADADGRLALDEREVGLPGFLQIAVVAADARGGVLVGVRGQDQGRREEQRQAQGETSDAPLTHVRMDVTMATFAHVPDPDLDARVTRIDPALDLEAEIKRLRQERDAIILAHYYQESELQDLADVVGDSLALAQAAAKAKKKVIVFAGVHFMAETAKILNPDSIVVVPDLRAGCSLADGCPAPQFARFKERYPGYYTIVYVNCSADVKAMADMICTSSNAAQIVKSIPKDQKILFAPDRYLAKWVMKESGRDDIVYWPGTCMVHEIFSAQEITKLKVEHPKAHVIAHPECDQPVLTQADFIGSTSALIDYTVKTDADTFIVATEPGVLHQMARLSPKKTFLTAPGQGNCACNTCPHMRLNTLEKLYLCLRDLKPRVEVPEEVRVKALVPIQRMLDFSAQAKAMQKGD